MLSLLANSLAASQMAQTYQNADGSPAGCYPAADVIGTTMTYTGGSAPNTLASVTVFFNTINISSTEEEFNDDGGAQRVNETDGFIKITCLTGGPTSNFAYTTVGDTGNSSQIDTTADCQRSGLSPPPPPPPPPQAGYACLDGACMMVENVTGVPLNVCQEMCLQKYMCVKGMCVINNCSKGVPLPVCKDVCQ
jgi:hypothetical protein